jgi:hypothetical protein
VLEKLSISLLVQVLLLLVLLALLKYLFLVVAEHKERLAPVVVLVACFMKLLHS